MNQRTLDLAREAFWDVVAKNHPERTTRDLYSTTAYDFEVWTQKAYEVWLEMNKPVYFVQRTKVQVLEVRGAATPEDAEKIARGTQDADWTNESKDTECDYVVLSSNGTML